MTARRAEIAGAGFAGLVAAISLARQGWAVRVHEAASGPRSIGSGLYVFAFAQEALAAVGALDRVRQDAYVPRRRVIMIDGHRRSTTALDAVLTTTRARLHAALWDTAAEAGVRFALDSEAVGADPAGALALADGTRLDADLVIAADGARSALAQSAGFTLDRVRHTDGITRVLLDRDGMGGPEWDDIYDLYDYRRRPLRVLYTPCGRGLFYICLMTPAGDEAAAEVPVDQALWTMSFPMLRPALSRVGQLGRHDRYGTTRLDRWVRGRVAVVGDAAHAMPSSLGQGAGVSMLNALRLAEAVGGSADIESGLASWQAAMRPIVDQWQRQAEQVATQRSLAGARHPGHDLAAELTTPLEAA